MDALSANLSGRLMRALIKVRQLTWSKQLISQWYVPKGRSPGLRVVNELAQSEENPPVVQSEHFLV